ncbi:Zinc transporter ZIP1 [Chelonia mydas]|uniref:Zinc transporter ZIP1 n=1 Tax=Chelonia mydas TaxID=8469 RepID=M7AU16_CHEMY|nr:Zinc transporter ZIP1 [Chelonia mydas]
MAEWPGPGADPDQMIWSPGSSMAVLPSPTGLEVKLGSLVTLLLLTILCGLAPLCVFRPHGSGAGSLDTRRKVLSLVSCFAGGVFLATCLLDLVPDYLASINEALAALRVTVTPVPLAGVHPGHGLLPGAGDGADCAGLQGPVWLPGGDTGAAGGLGPGQHRPGPALAGPPAGAPPRRRPHLHVDFNAHSAIRSFILVFSLSLHSVFEGLAVGLQEASAKVLEICLALLIHKCVIAFSLSLKLLQGRLRPRAVVGCLLLFALMSPLGIGLGVALTETSGALHQLSRSVLEGLATGTFIYITFLEILPHELSSSEQRILKIILLLAGFALVTSILFIKI